MADAPYLLITTTRAAWVLDTRTGRAKLIDKGRGVYYGVSFSADEIFIACRQAEVGAERDGQRNVILCFDADLRPTRVLHPPAPVRDVHQICYHAGTLLICSTFDDAVVRCHLASNTWDAWHPFGPGFGDDRHHINSVTVEANGYLLAGNRPAGWAARFSHTLDPVGDRVWLGVGTHNVWSDDGRLAVCSSDEGTIRWEGGAAEAIVEEGWLRGYAHDGARRYVGVSQNRVRTIRERSDCMVLQLAKDGSTTGIHAFRGFGMVHDIRVVGVADRSHNGLALTLTDSAVARLPVGLETTTDPISLLPQMP